MNSQAATLERDGVFISPAFVSDLLVLRLRESLRNVGTDRAGARGFALAPIVREHIATDGVVGSLAAELCGSLVKPVRVLFFDKTPDANWAVPWHQDRTIAVNARAEIDGYGPWTVKDGVIHVEPPVSILQSMVTLRVFLDDCDEDGGPLEVALGSHRFGRVPTARIRFIVNRLKTFVGIGKAGDILVMRTIAIHRSQRSAKPTHRRVLHVDYSPSELPLPLEWRM